MRVNGASDEKRVRSLLTGHEPGLSTGEVRVEATRTYGEKPGQAGNPWGRSKKCLFYA